MSNVISFADFRASAAAIAAQEKPVNVDPAPSVEETVPEGVIHVVDGVERFNFGFIMSSAMLGVVRVLLAEVAQNGMPEKSEFYIQFDTTAPGVEIAPWMRDKYPKAMTVVIGSWWRNLEVTDDGFSVELNFADVVERLVVPFSALESFVDSGESFGLRFNAPAPEETPTGTAG